MGKVMEDWEELETKYQRMRNRGDLKAANDYKQTVAKRFQDTVQALEIEALAEKRQLIQVHRMRVFHFYYKNIIFMRYLEGL